MMKKSSFLIIILLLPFFTNAQDRVNTPKKLNITPISEIKHATGWSKNMEGEWDSAFNKIPNPYYPNTGKKAIRDGLQEFNSISLKKVVVNNTDFVLFSIENLYFSQGKRYLIKHWALIDSDDFEDNVKKLKPNKSGLISFPIIDDGTEDSDEQGQILFKNKLLSATKRNKKERTIKSLVLNYSLYPQKNVGRFLFYNSISGFVERGEALKEEPENTRYTIVDWLTPSIYTHTYCTRFLGDYLYYEISYDELKSFFSIN